MDRKETAASGKTPFQNDRERDRKYYDEGRDTDNAGKPASHVEEGDEDYDDEAEGVSFEEQETARESNNSRSVEDPF